jgi:predicted enzyme related to lactoylglutathione lyase
MKSNPIGWFEIYVADMARAKKFYETVLQVTLNKIPADDRDMWGFPADLGRYGAGGALVAQQGLVPGGCGTMVYFSCADCGVEAERAAKAGGKVCLGKKDIGQYGSVAIVTDTEGNTIGLHTPPKM